jgi:hypothetical protein
MLAYFISIRQITMVVYHSRIKNSPVRQVVSIKCGICCGLQRQEVRISFRRNRKIGIKKIEGMIHSHTHQGRIMWQSFLFKEYRSNTVHGIKIGTQQKYEAY